MSQIIAEPPQQQNNQPEGASPQKIHSKSPSKKGSKSRSPRQQQRKENNQYHNRGGGGYHRNYRQNSRSRSRGRKFVNVMERWHYQRCSEIKIHFYVKNLYIGHQSEDNYLHFVRDRVQKAGVCDIIQITGKNREEQTIDIAIGMRYDQDAKLIYIGKKHINLASKYNINKNKNIIPVISNMFEILLEKNDELDKTKLENNLKRQRFGDHSGKKRSSSRSGSKSSSRKSSGSSRGSPASRSRSRSRRSAASQPQIKAQQPMVQKQEIIKPMPSIPQPQQQTRAPQVQYKPVMLSLAETPEPSKETIQVFLIPKEFTLQECLQSIQDFLQMPTLPDGQFKMDKSKNGDQTFEYLEVTLDYPCFQRLQISLPLRIKDVPCLVCQRTNNMSFRDTLRPFQLYVQPMQKLQSRQIYNEFKNYGEIVAFYNVDSKIRDAEDFILIYALENSIKKLNPTNSAHSITIQKDPHTKVLQADIQFNRPPLTQTIWYQSQSLQKQQQQRLQAIQQQQTPQQPQQQAPPIQQKKVESESSSSSSSSRRSGDSRSSRSESSGSRQNRPNYRRYDNRRGGQQQQRNYNNYNRQNNYRGRGNYQDDDRRRGGGRQYQRQDRGRRYDN